MAATYTLISSNVLSSSAASVTFSAIPSTYTDLVLRASLRTDRTAAIDFPTLQFNTDTGTNYSNIRLYGDGTTAGSTPVSNSAPTYTGYLNGGTSTANTFGSYELYIPSYTANQNKQVMTTAAQEDNATTARMSAISYLWRNTSAINQIVLTSTFAANFVSGSSFYLYGISKN